MKIEQKQERLSNYFMDYVDFIANHSDELKSKSKKLRSGDINLSNKKYTYFGFTNGVTVINKKSGIEMSVIFESDSLNVYFEKTRLLNYIESDLNSVGLGKNIASNKTTRESDFNNWFNTLINSGSIVAKGKGYTILREDIF